MRFVTKKPPKILIPAKNKDTVASIKTVLLVDPICRSAPNIIIDEMALVTAIRGVCSE
jgi:hypothetical protein